MYVVARCLALICEPDIEYTTQTSKTNAIHKMMEKLNTRPEHKKVYLKHHPAYIIRFSVVSNWWKLYVSDEKKAQLANLFI